MANINWENLPSTSTPINATNLNKVGEGLVNVGISVDNTYKVNILSVGNLFKKDTATDNSYFSSTSGTISSSSSWSVSDYMEVVEDEKLHLNGNYSSTVGEGVYGIYYDSSKSVVGSITYSNYKANGTIIVIPSGVKYIRLSIQTEQKNTFKVSITNKIFVNGEEIYNKSNMGNITVDDIKCRNLAILNDFTQTASQSSTYKTLGYVYLETGTYTLSWTQSAAMTSNTRNTPGYVIENTRVWQTENSNSNLSVGRSSWTFTITTAGNYEFDWWINVPSTTVNMTNFMLEKGSDATLYTPYKSFGEELSFLLNKSNSITVTYQKCKRIGKLIYLNVSFTTNSVLAAYTTLFDNAPANTETPLQIPLFNSSTGTFDNKALVLNGTNIQNRTSLENGVTYRFNITYIED